VSVTGTEFFAKGSYERVANALVFAAFSARPAPDHYQVEYRGSLVGGVVLKVGVTRTREGDGPRSNSLLSSGGSTATMILTETPNEIAVMEMERGDSAKFYTLTRAKEPIIN
jgi:hypothetical protein